jgi:hypothetical protein
MVRFKYYSKEHYSQLIKPYRKRIIVSSTSQSVYSSEEKIQSQ